MGISIKINDATFSNYFSSLTLPNRSGLIGEYILGGTQAASTRNRATPASPLTLIGTPTYSTNYATVASTNSSGTTNGFETGMLPPSDCTIISISNRGTGIGPGFHAGYGPGATGLYFDGSNFSFSNGYTNGAVDEAFVPLTPPSADSTAFFMQAGVGRIGQTGRVYVYKSGSVVFDDSTRTDSSRDGAATLKIGGATQSPFSNTLNIAYCAAFNRLLSQSEIADVYAQLKAYYTGQLVIQ
jgi:hypothetical protein